MFGIGVLKDHPMARPVVVRSKRAFAQFDRAVEKHSINPIMIVEVFDVPQT